MADSEPVAERGRTAQGFLRRCDELAALWDRREADSQASGNHANAADTVVRFLAFGFAAAATVVSTLVASEVDGKFLTSTTGAILAGLAALATGLQGFFLRKAKHHYERVDIYREVAESARTLKSKLEDGVITLEKAYEELHELTTRAGERPEMPNL